VRLIMYYPQEIGRNIDEVVRAVKALQESDRFGAIPAGWPNNELIGDRIIVPPPTCEKDAATRMKEYDGYDWWFCHVPRLSSAQRRRGTPVRAVPAAGRRCRSGRPGR